MITKKVALKVLNAALSTGGDYAEIYLEENFSQSISVDNGCVEKIAKNETYGAGIRILNGFQSVYGYTSTLTEKKLLALAETLAKKFNEPRKIAVNDIERQKVKKDCVTLITQVLVDASDPAFKNPTKPIGAFYSLEEAKKEEKEKGYTFMEDAGRGYRRVVASPKPIDIVEKRAISKLIDSGIVVIACGGGGIPVIKNDKHELLEGVDAVIDKDLSSALLAKLIDADKLLILTSIDKGGVTSSVQWGRGFQNEATGKLSEITSPKGEALVKLKYDSEGRISEMIKRGEMPIKYTYDNLDRITEIQNGDEINMTCIDLFDSMCNRINQKKTEFQPCPFHVTKIVKVERSDKCKTQFCDLAFPRRLLSYPDR